jgi:ABC-type sugar transport system permease subunit
VRAADGTDARDEVKVGMQMATRPLIQALQSPTSRRLRLGLLFVSPWIIGFCVFYLYPFLATFYYSFTRFTGIGNPVVIGLSNYSGLLHDGTFRTALFNTFYYTIIEVPFSTAAALGLALLLNMNVRGQAVYRTLFRRSCRWWPRP